MKQSSWFYAMVLMGAASVLGLHPAAEAAVFSNGSFEVPDVGGQAGAGVGFLTGSSGWEVTANGITIFDNANPAGPASDGAQFITLRNNGTSATIEQTFDTVINTLYVVNWDEGYASTGGPYNQFNPPATGDYTAEVFDDQAALLATDTRTVTADVSDPIWGVHWTPVTLSFTATSTTSTLRFTQISNSIPFNSYGAAIDDVFLQVPEPASLALLAAGGLLLARRRVI